MGTLAIIIPAYLAFMALFGLFAVYAERKVSAYIQNRLGPTEVGPYGLFQTFADILKLLLKENITPRAAERPLFFLAPVIIFASVFAGFAVIPVGPAVSGAVLDVGLLYLMAVVSIHVIGLVMAGWGSNNKYAMLGSVRSVAQAISYEIPAATALLAAVMMYGTLNLYEISAQQGLYSTEPVRLLGIWDVSEQGGFLAWGIFRYPHLIVAWLVYFIASLAECNRAPFDLPEAESELVSGFHTEYGGLRFGLIMLSEYGNMFLVGLIAAVLFLGGWNTPLPNILAFDGDVHTAGFWELLSNLQFGHLTTGVPGTLGFALWGGFWILLKGFAAVFVHMWIRWTLPRVRVDQLMRLGWKVLTPIAFLLIILSGVWKLCEVYGHL